MATLTPWSVFRVPDDAPVSAETLGTKRKFWFDRDGLKWLFKATRPGTGEHWAEVIVAELAEVLGLPHARYELAHWRDANGTDLAGSVTPTFAVEPHEIVHGNELLADIDPSYPPAGARYVRTREHTLDAVSGALRDGVGLPVGWSPPAGVQGPEQVFGGYLLLDAWVSNTDRHHENWGLLVDQAAGTRALAPTFDHASSLGAHESDHNRARRLATNDPGFQIPAFVGKARSALYASPGDKHPLSPIDAFRAWAKRVDCAAWLGRLAAVDPETPARIVDRVPAEEMSGPERAFALAILECNKGRILRAR